MMCAHAPLQARRAYLLGGVFIFGAAASTSAFAGTLGQAPDDDISVWRIAGVLLLCAALAIAAALALKYRVAGGPIFALLAKTHRRLQLVEVLRLSHQANLSIVSCDHHELLVLSSAQGASVIKELPAATDALARRPEG